MNDGDLPDLPPDVAALLRDARDVPPAPAPERRKVAARLALTTGLAVPGASLAGAKLFTVASAARAVGLAVAVAAVGGVAVGTLRPTPAPPHANVASRAPVTPRVVPAPAPRVTPSPVGATSTPAVVAPSPVAPSPVARVAAPAPLAVSDDALDAELALLAEAHGALARGDASTAEGALARHARRFPRGRLAPEREALRVECLAARGERAAAEAARTAFHRRFPGSVLGAAVDRAAGDAP